MNSQLNKLDYTKRSNSNWIEKRKNDIGLTNLFPDFVTQKYPFCN